jgi:hypothetical protein
MPRLLQTALIVSIIFGLKTNSPAAVLLSFGGYTWNQANVPNTGLQLGVDDATTRSGATFGPAQTGTNLTRTGSITGFVEGQAGVNTGVGYLSRITKRRNLDPNPTNPLESTGTRAVNIPQDNAVSGGNIGTATIRRGIEVGWTAGTGGFARPVLKNAPGTDFVIWESGDANQPDAMMTRVRNATTLQFSDWYYFTPTPQPVSGSVLFGFAYDLTNFGLANGTQIDLIEMANMVSKDRIQAVGTNTANGWVAQGKVRPEVGTIGVYSAAMPGPDPGNISPPYGVPFGSSTYDPDPLYVSVLGNLQNFAVPEPASLIAWSLIIGFGMVGNYARRWLVQE